MENLFNEVINDIDTALALCDISTFEINAINSTFKGLLENQDQSLQSIFPYLKINLLSKAINKERSYRHKYAFMLNGRSTIFSFVFAKKTLSNGQDYILIHGFNDSARDEMEAVVASYEKTFEEQKLSLIEAKQAADKANRIKTEFISIISHELRTPLTAIHGSIKLALGGVTGELPEKLHNMLILCSNNCHRLISLVNDLLDITKIESGKLEYCFEVVALNGLLKEAVEINASYAQQFDVNIRYENTGPDILVTADPRRLTQIVTNLISNACKFSPNGSSMELTLEKGEDNAVISVLDRGPGIPEKEREAIFGRFTQVDSSDTRHYGGVGLGLNISLSIAKAHKGQLLYKDREGGGSIFQLVLPLEANAVGKQ